jgi:hypothetical protein
MKKVFIALSLGIFLVMVAGFAYAASQLYGKTELIYHDKNKAYNGYTLWSKGSYGYMIDMEGNLVHKWANTGLMLYEDGHRINGFRDGATNGVRELDWDGNVYSQWLNTDRPEVGPHHAHVRIFNQALNNYTILAVSAYRDITYQEALDNGADPDCPIDEDTTPYDDGVIEFDRDGNLIWEWRFWDHIIQDYDATKLNYGDPTAPENWGKIDINLDTNTRKGLAPDWNHVNSMDYNEQLDQIIVNSREHGEIYLVDHSTTTEEAAGSAGDFLWRWGNPANYGQGDIPTFNDNGHEQLFGAHDIQWIKDVVYTGGPSLPGAGNFLIFENGSYRPAMIAHSTIFEINPYDGPMENGVYIWQHDAGHTNTMRGYNSNHGNLSNQVVWEYCAYEHAGFNNSKGMYSAHISGCQRLPNGNTLICAGEEGHFVEVTYDTEEVVWEYVNPVINDTTVLEILPPGDVNNSAPNNSVFRCYRYGPDFPGLAGLDLTPMGTITGRTGLNPLEKTNNLLGIANVN